MLIDGGARKVLSIGVAYYNAHHAAIFAARGTELWTIDVDPQCERWGSPGRHVIGNALDLDAYFPPDTFDVVILNGVLGYGIDDQASVGRALAAIAAVLKPNGRLVIGWNHDKADDPTAVPEARELFRPYPGLDGTSHLALEDDTMVYDFLEKRPENALPRRG